ncbi:MAG TPA: hypothetical protein VLG36_05500 [Candidatus Chromulinivoraceae bacterium]|nr:hypothetical protein [Candidatus Chromulinivoraceae bacterium]
MATQKQKPRTYARNRPATVSRKGYEKIFESDSTYFLKLVVFVLLGTFWVKFQTPVTWLGLPLSAIPVGFLVGLLLVRKFEKYQADRKIWYAILVVITILCYFAPSGIVI